MQGRGINHPARGKWASTQCGSIERLMQSVELIPGIGCWVWIGRTTKPRPGNCPYGQVKIEGRCVRAHRAMWTLTNGPIPPGMLVCHHCDFPLCVNPAHLFLGTHSENMRDAARKGRLRWPSNFPSVAELTARNTRLTDEQIVYIRSCGKPAKDLARELGFGRSWISKVQRGVARPLAS